MPPQYFADFPIDLRFWRDVIFVPPALVAGPERNLILVPEFRRVANVPEYGKGGFLQPGKHWGERRIRERSCHSMAQIRLAANHLQAIEADFAHPLYLIQ